MKGKTPGSRLARLPARRRREDGANTRAEILEAAGKVFADKGFDRATGREIAARAKVNSAAVNYYFGSIDGLYVEALIEAHRRILTYDAFAAIVHGEGTPEDKLRALMTLLVRTLMGPAASSWTWRVLSREALSPSEAFGQLRNRELLPKKQLGMEIVSGLLGLPIDHPAVARCWLSIVAPCLMLVIGDRKLLKQMLPEIRADDGGIDAMIDHLVRFALAGIAAIGAQVGAMPAIRAAGASRGLR